MVTRRIVKLAGVLLVALVAAGGCAYWLMARGPVPVGNATARPEGEGWVDLLDDAHVAQWKNVTDDKDIFEIAAQEMHIFGKSLWPLRYVGYTGESFGDFDLHVEVKVSKGANSGIFLRSKPSDPVQRGFEIQVLDDHGKPPTKSGSGAIYDVVTPMFNMARPAGECNSYDIAVAGTEVTVTMNGWKVIDTDMAQFTEPYGKFKAAYSNMPREGMVALQDHGGEVWYRNILIRKRP